MQLKQSQLPITRFKAVNKDSRNIERDFLAKFYNATGGRSWMKNEGWNTMGTRDETDYCTWYGVECERSGHYVIALQLINNNLTGSLPTGIVDGLQSLMVFEIALNGLRGEIPEEYGHTTITDIDLSYNQFEGILPHGICNIITCSAHNNPRLKCPKDNCNENHCVMDVCNCGKYSICQNEVDCAGKLCSKCVPSSYSPYIKVCR
ncbi:predicted protein [Naegleria gruberi]|uniref:Predicted protein n=1 Tax=Naegleria gruberi TaxID=5762 RepID=D2VVD9_NAEGR|nr:uncharacterized protein NAEGRDRAFT_72981 [Naegleria gruberi]EFC39215.1 predicted protein [Naegleria gruberi]|eukprot:XP_002671959.1 predicted protein [Naegleria gruberi strain NEG-M]